MLGQQQLAAPQTPCVEIGALLAGEAALERRRSDINVFDIASAAGLGQCIAWPW